MARRGVPVNGFALKAIRRLKGIRVTELADMVGIAHSYVSNVESGRNPAMSEAKFCAVVHVLGLDDDRAIRARI